LSGVLGIDPGPWTLRDLVRMHTGFRRDRWGRSASVMSLIANCHKDPKKGRAFDASDFTPADVRVVTRRPGAIPLTPSTLRAMKKLFVQE